MSGNGGAGPVPIARYARSGGRLPSDDEWLEVAEDGSWAARRTVSGRTAGRFAGRLEGPALEALRSGIAVVQGTGDAFVPTPRHGATEAVDVEGASLTLGSNEDAPGPWRPLLAWLRDAVQDRVVRSPVAALTLEAGADAASIAQAGPEPVRLEPATVSVRVARIAPDGTRLGEWESPGVPGTAPTTSAFTGRPARGSAPGSPGIVTAGDGWSLDLPFSHGLGPASGDVLQVRVLLRVRDGGARTVRLYAPVRIP